MSDEITTKQLSEILNNLTIFVHKLDDRLKKIENKNVKFKPPTLIELEEFMTIFIESKGFIGIDPKETAAEMLDWRTADGWQTKTRKIKNWKSDAMCWVRKACQFSNNKNIKTPSARPKLEFKNQITEEAKERFIGE